MKSILIKALIDKTLQSTIQAKRIAPVVTNEDHTGKNISYKINDIGWSCLRDLNF